MKNHIPLLLPITNIRWDEFNHLIGQASIEGINKSDPFVFIVVNHVYKKQI